MTKSELARRINKARQNINDILNRKSIDTELLYNISVALDYDFFRHYVMELTSQDIISEPKGEYAELRAQIAEYEKSLIICQKDNEIALNEVRLQNEIISLLKKQVQ
ncbi:MAG: hypothetical protein H6581_04155 [Bacteroidia bacterium]|nr:hypothetical protein [Bacteroidia bacterium]